MRCRGRCLHRQWYQYAPQFLSSARGSMAVWPSGTPTRRRWRGRRTNLACPRKSSSPHHRRRSILRPQYGLLPRRRRPGHAGVRLSAAGRVFQERAEAFLRCKRASGRFRRLSRAARMPARKACRRFMPGSLRNYAVDFDNDGRIDLAGDVDDAVGTASQLSGQAWLADR